MLVHTDIQKLPVFKNAVITIGVFDGVHTGHQQIIHLMKTEAQAINGETVLITFDPHPRTVLQKTSDIKLINTFEERVALLEKYGINHLVVVPFTKEFAQQTAEQYIDQFLVNTFHPHTIVIGHDHRFGKNREGNFALLEQKASTAHFKVKEIPPHVLQEVVVSSTRIRQALLESNIEIANKLLGYDYFFSGLVVEGNRLGKTIGYPTANIQINNEHKLIPGYGVYAVNVLHKDTKFLGMMNIGTRPTIAGTIRIVEVNIFDFDEEIYGEILTVAIKAKLRSEIKFDTLNTLKTQLAKDKETTLRLLA